MGILQEIHEFKDLIQPEIVAIRTLKAKYENKNKRDIVKDYLIISGGLSHIKSVFGDIDFFLHVLEHDIYSICFDKSYISKLRKYFKNLERI